MGICVQASSSTQWGPSPTLPIVRGKQGSELLQETPTSLSWDEASSSPLSVFSIWSLPSRLAAGKGKCVSISQA